MPARSRIRDAVLIAGHLAVVLVLAARLNIWIDESYTLDTTGSSLGYALRQAANLESQPPLYFLLLTAWRSLDRSILFARLFSVLSIAGLLLIAIPAARRYLPGVDHGWLLLLLASNPFLVWAASEVRLYAFCLLMSAALLLLFHRAFLGPRVTAGNAALFGLVALGGALTHYYLWFLHLAFLAALLAGRRRQSLKYYLLVMSAVVLLSAPLLWLLLPRVLATGELLRGQGLPLASGLKQVLLRLQDYLLPVDRLPRLPGLAARLLFLAVLVGAALLPRRRASRERVVLWVIVGVLAACFLLLLVLADQFLGMRRHTFPLFLPTVLAFFALFPGQPRLGFRALRLTVVGIVLLGAYTLFTTYLPMAKSGDYARVASYLQAMEQPDQPILAFNSESAMPLSHYYRGVNRIVPIPGPASLRSFQEESFVIRSVAQVAAAVSSASPTHRAAWYVRSGAGGNRGWDYHGELLEQYLAASYTVLSTRDFYGCRVQLLRRNQL